MSPSRCRRQWRGEGLPPQRPVVARDHQRRGRRRSDRCELLSAHGEWHRLRPHAGRAGPQLRRLGALVRQQPDHVRPHHREPLVADAQPVDLRRTFGSGAGAAPRSPVDVGRLEGAQPRHYGCELRHRLPAPLRRLPLRELRPGLGHLAALPPERARRPTPAQGVGAGDRSRGPRAGLSLPGPRQSHSIACWGTRC